MSEARDGKNFAAWLTLHGFRFIHVPNEGKRSYAVAASLKAQGLQPGFPDYLIFDDPQIAWELKSPGKEATTAQRKWLGTLHLLGWKVGCGTIKEAQDFVETFHEVPSRIRSVRKY